MNGKPTKVSKKAKSRLADTLKYIIYFEERIERARRALLKMSVFNPKFCFAIFRKCTKKKVLTIKRLKEFLR